MHVIYRVLYHSYIYVVCVPACALICFDFDFSISPVASATNGSHGVVHVRTMYGPAMGWPDLRVDDHSLSSITVIELIEISFFSIRFVSCRLYAYVWAEMRQIDEHASTHFIFFSSVIQVHWLLPPQNRRRNSFNSPLFPFGRSIRNMKLVWARISMIRSTSVVPPSIIFFSLLVEDY